MQDNGRFSHEVPRLIDRIKELVAEERRLEECGSGEVLEAKRHEIARLQGRLAAVVKRELPA